VEEPGGPDHFGLAFMLALCIGVFVLVLLNGGHF
jgi:hypothetical protein